MIYDSVLGYCCDIMVFPVMWGNIAQYWVILCDVMVLPVMWGNIAQY